MGGKVVILAVLEDEDAVGLEQGLFKDEGGNLGQLFQGVGGIGEDEVEGRVAAFEKTEHVGSHALHVEAVAFALQFLYALLNETVVVAVHLDADHLLAASRQQLKGDAARAREEVEGGGAVEVDVAGEHVEDVFLSKVGRGPCLKGSGNVEVPPFELSCNDSHL